MTNEEKMVLLLSLYQAIFQSKAQNADALTMSVHNPYLTPLGTAVGRWFVNGTVRGFDFDVQDGNRVLELRIMEQNTAKTDAAGNRSYYANLAVQGNSIAWIIDRKKKMDAFLGRIQNGQWHASKPRAVQPVKTAALPHPVSEIPDIPGDVGIPDYVVTQMNNEENPYELSEYA